MNNDINPLIIECIREKLIIKYEHMKVKFTNNRIEESALVVWRNYKGMCWNIKNLGHKSQDFWSGQKITGA